jgi:hypothetical protein
MQDWVKVVFGGSDIYINLATVRTIVPISDGAIVYFIDGSNLTLSTSVADILSGKALRST